jgi:hypothetical protein
MIAAAAPGVAADESNDPAEYGAITAFTTCTNAQASAPFAEICMYVLTANLGGWTWSIQDVCLDTSSEAACEATDGGLLVAETTNVEHRHTTGSSAIGACGYIYDRSGNMRDIRCL